MAELLKDCRTQPVFIHSTVDDMPLTLEAFRVYSHLARRAGRSGKAWPSYTTIGEHCFRGSYPNASKPSLKAKAIAAVQELIAWGLVEKKEQFSGQGQTSNTYSLTDAEHWATEPPKIENCNVRKGRPGQTRSKRKAENVPPRLVELTPPVNGVNPGGVNGDNLTRLVELTPPVNGAIPKGTPIEGTPIEGTPFFLESRKNEGETGLVGNLDQASANTLPVNSNKPAKHPELSKHSEADQGAAAVFQNSKKYFEDPVGDRFAKADELPLWRTGRGPNDWDEDMLQGIVEWMNRKFPRESHTRRDAIAFICKREKPTAALHHEYPALMATCEEIKAILDRRAAVQMAQSSAPTAEPVALPTQEPSLSPEMARAQFLKNTQQLWWADGASRGIAVKRCRAYGFAIDPDSGPYDPQVEEPGDVAIAEPDPEILTQIRASLDSAEFDNSQSRLGIWGETFEAGVDFEELQYGY